MTLFTWSERKTRTLFWITIFSLVAPLASTFFLLEEFGWNRLGFALRQGAVTALITCIGLFLYHLTIRRVTTPEAHPERFRLVWLWISTLVAGVLTLFNLPVLLSLGIGVLLNIGIALVLRKHLLWEVLFASLGLGALFLTTTFITTVLFPSPLDDLWLSINTTGALVIGVPVAQLAAAALLGMLWGPLISYLKEPRPKVIEVISHNFHPRHLNVKATIGLSALSLALILGGWFGYNYLLKPQEVSAKLATLEAVPLNAEILLTFSRPVSSSDIRLSVTPEIKGDWEFRDTSLGNRAFSSLAFIPSETFVPDQEYTIEAQDVKSIIGTGSETHAIVFKSEPVPTITSTTPIEGAADIAVCSPLIVTFEQSLSDYWNPEFTLSPSAEFSASRDGTVYTLTPKTCLEQGTTYTLSAALSVTNGEPATPIEISHFQTIIAPGLSEHSPQGDLVLTSTPYLEIGFTKPMKTDDPSSYLNIEPSINGTWEWNTEGTKLRYTFASTLAYNTRYTTTVLKGLPDQTGGFLPADAIISFSTIGPIKVSSFSPGPGSKDVKPETAVYIKFNQEVVTSSIEEGFSISPQIDGTFSWSGNSLTFKPKSNLSYSTSYTVTIKGGAKSVYGQPLEKDYQATFTTKAAPIPPATPITMGLSEQGRAINGYIFGKGPNIIFIHGGIHGGKERSNVLLLERFVKEINANQSLVASDKTVIIVPNANPDAYATRTDKYNSRGVNININFQTVGWIPWGVSDEAPNAGPEPFSEKETRVIRDIVNKYNPQTMVAFHSKGGLVNPEYGHGPSQDLARQYAQQSGYAYYEVPEWDYPGTATKWFLENGGGPSITVELSSHSIVDWSTHKKALFGLID